jgi:hypothetical protein
MSRAAVSEDLRLAISYRDYWLVVMSGTFVGGYAILLLVMVGLGDASKFLGTARSDVSYLPWALILGVLLAWIDAKRTVAHCAAYAAVERARQRVRWLAGMWDFERARSAHRRILLADSGIFAVPAIAWVLAFSLLGGLLPIAAMAATEHLMWRFYWRPELERRMSR